MSKDEIAETPDSPKEQKVRNFIRRHKAKLSIGGGVVVVTTALIVLARKCGKMEELTEFIEEQNFEDQFMPETTSQV
jgi:hypothetical protein